MRYAFLVPLIVVVALLAGTSRADAQAKVATVKPGEVFNKMAETQDLKAKIESEGKTLQAVGQEKKAKLDRLQQELQQLKPDHPSYRDKARELRVATIDAKAWQETTASDLEANEKTQMLELFKKIESAVADVAKAKGYDIVLADVAAQLPTNVDAMNKQQFNQFVSQKNIWYASDAIDITNDVLAKLDADYKAGDKK